MLTCVRMFVVGDKNILVSYIYMLKYQFPFVHLVKAEWISWHKNFLDKGFDAEKMLLSHQKKYSESCELHELLSRHW